ncbi:hypothetical protein AB0L65_56035 [Nonomuraea sp. NPDC052116]|uniref:hypothetical protein n=1 Tax=Nonomuraea sp. NPDC052116 TaxID=3155665 RepID=UPI00343B5983
MADHHVRGLVQASGAIATGSGFTVEHIVEGTYSVTFNQPFSEAPSVVTTQVYPNTSNSTGGDTRDNSVVVYISPQMFRVITGDSSGKKTDRSFAFIATGN